jgi:biopolymer transport protein ExbD
MSMDLGGAKGGVKSDINVTPLVDVMLVLLIIMMLVAPLLQQGSPSSCRSRPTTATSPRRRSRRSWRSPPISPFYLNAKFVPEYELAMRIEEESERRSRKSS